MWGSTKQPQSWSIDDSPLLPSHTLFSSESCQPDALISSWVCQGQMALSWWRCQLWDFLRKYFITSRKRRRGKMSLVLPQSLVSAFTFGYLNKNPYGGEGGAWLLISCHCGKVNERVLGRKAREGCSVTQGFYDSLQGQVASYCIGQVTPAAERQACLFFLQCQSILRVKRFIVQSAPVSGQGKGVHMFITRKLFAVQVMHHGTSSSHSLQLKDRLEVCVWTLSVCVLSIWSLRRDVGGPAKCSPDVPIRYCSGCCLHYNEQSGEGINAGA